MAETEIEFSRPFHRTHPDTGELLPMLTLFRVGGVGMGLAEVYRPKNVDGELGSIFDEVRLIFVPTPPEDLSETEVLDIRFLDPKHSSLEVVTTPSLLSPHVLQLLED